MSPIKPTSSGFIEANGFKLWHEVYGDGDGTPVLLLHGGLMTIPEMMPLGEPLAKKRKVVGIELQGHGHSADTDRPLELETMGDDAAAVVDKLGLGKVDVVGYSLGAAVGLRLAIQHPDKVRRLVVISTPFAKNGWYPEARKGMSEVGASLAESLKNTPTGKLAAQWPEPARFPKFLDKLGKLLGEDYDWSADVKKLPMPVLLVFADHDSVSQQHIAEFFALLGGGISEPGWNNTKFTNVRLAIIPGYSHYNFMTSLEIAPIIEKYLADSQKPTQSGVAASQVTQ